MPQIRPLADLQDKLNDVYETIQKTDQPMFFTRDGQNDVVIMSFDTYNRNFNNNLVPVENDSYFKTVNKDNVTQPQSDDSTLSSTTSTHSTQNTTSTTSTHSTQSTINVMTSPDVSDTPVEEEKSSEEILSEARRKLQDMVDEYSNGCNMSYQKPKRRRKRR